MKFSAFKEREGSLSCFQNPDTGAYPEAAKFSHAHALFF
jgi:hypothetical protein